MKSESVISLIEAGYEGTFAEQPADTVISCHDLGYTVRVKSQRSKCCHSADKTILQNINCIFKPGLNAIMGATGSGKTSLIDTIAGRKDPVGVSGQFLINGCPPPKHFKSMTGYVVQNDKVMDTLTTRENIMFSANLRLRKYITTPQKNAMVDEIIQELGLTECADTMVGNDFTRGISGGERKRTNIGMELIISPKLLFLDEPTSGLDATTANAVMRLLSRISQQGRTLILSIHQPRYSILKLFDSLLLLSKGQTVYFGPSSNALGYFAGLGYVCEEYNNPSDFLLDIINGDDETIKNESLIPALKDETKDISPTDGRSKCDALAYHYSQSSYSKHVTSELELIHHHYANSGVFKNGHEEYATTLLTQLKYVSKRMVIDMVRNPMIFVFQVLIVFIKAALLGLLYWNLENEVPIAIQNRAGLMFFLLMSTAVSNVATIELFVRERAFYIHEYSNGFYRPTAYLFSKILADFIPMRMFTVLLLAIFTYSIIDLKPDWETFWFFVAVLLAEAFLTSTMGLFLGMLTGVHAVAHALSSFIIMVSAMFGGLLVNLETIPKWIQWLKYLSFVKYGFEALLANELKDERFYTQNPMTGKWDVEVLAGNQYLDSLHIRYDKAWDRWQNVVIILFMGLVYLVMGYVQLRCINKYK